VTEIHIASVSWNYLDEFLIGRLLIHMGHMKHFDSDLDRHLSALQPWTGDRLTKAPEAIGLDRRQRPSCLSILRSTRL
jgi:hypothetical protein